MRVRWRSEGPRPIAAIPDNDMVKADVARQEPASDAPVKSLRPESTAM